MSRIQSHHQFQLAPARRWSRGRIVLVVTAVVVAGSAVALWRAPGQRSTVQVALAGVVTASDTMTVYKSPECDCCDKWIGELRHEGFMVKVVEQADISPVKTRLGVPTAALSCHTATIGRYVIEGHVPLEDISRLLTERPAVVGIAVPGMPTGTLGMDGPKVPYTVVSFDRSGTLATFAAR